MELEEIREKIDLLDQELLNLFEQRYKLIMQVAEYKLQNKLPVFDAKREEKVLANKLVMVKNVQSTSYIENLWQSLMHASKKEQLKLLQLEEKQQPFFSALELADKRIAFQGVEGAYSEEALLSLGVKKEQLKAYESFRQIFTAIQEGEVAYGILPLENASTGSLGDVYDDLLDFQYQIVHEVILPINHCLLAKKDTLLNEINIVYSHEQGLSQCSEYLRQHPQWQVQAYHNTAMSAALVAKENNMHAAAIGSQRLAELYGLKVLAYDIQNNRENFTRFVLLAKERGSLEAPNKVSIAFTLPHITGSLYRAIKLFHDYSINMLKIYSRPIVDQPWEYRFFLDFTGQLLDKNTQAMLDQLAQETENLQILGNYHSNLR